MSLKLQYRNELSPAECIESLKQRCRNRLSVTRIWGRLDCDYLKVVERIYLPHWIWRFKVAIQGSPLIEMCALVNGINCDHTWLVEEPVFKYLESGGSQELQLEIEVEQEKSLYAARSELKWQIIGGRFGKISRFRIESQEGNLVFLPFWLGYYCSDSGQVRVETVNGIGGEVAGQKLSLEILKALTKKCV